MSSKHKNLIDKSTETKEKDIKLLDSYSYDDKNRVTTIKKCYQEKCNITNFSYQNNRIYEFKVDEQNNLKSKIITKKKDSVKVQLTLDKNDKILTKRVSTFNKHHLKRSETVTRNDTLVFEKKNTIKNNKILEENSISYYKMFDAKNYTDSEYKITYKYNKDNSIKSINNEYSKEEYKFYYNKKGLLKLIKKYYFINNEKKIKLKYSYY